MLTAAEVDAILDEFEIRPGGTDQIELEFDCEQSILTLSRHAFDSRNDEVFYAEVIPDDVYPSPLLFTVHINEDDLYDELSFIHEVCRCLAQFAAHEILEWTRYQMKMAYDPHIEGEPAVTL